METLTIGQLAKSAGVNVETVRYYERRGLIPEPSRRASGYRQYTRDYAARIRFIKRAQELGFSLNEIAELLALRVGSDTVCSDVKQRAEVKIDNIDAKIQTLKQMKQALVTLVAVCNENGITSECPILETLEGKGTL
jgi:Hg(II)-responsive transcriptional regulator